MTKPEDRRPKTKDRIVWIIFAFLAVFVYFFALGSIPFLGPDESRYAQVAREMFERNDFITPTLDGFNWFEKPALLYWLEIVSYKIFGVSEFSARFGSTVCGLLTVFSLWVLGKVVCSQFVENQTTISDFSNWLFLISASSIGLLIFSRGASFDIILTFPVTAALVCFFIYDLKSSAFRAVKYLFGFYFFVGVALLAKGLVGIVFPFAIVAFYYVLQRKFPSKTLIFSLFWGTLCSLLIAAVWYVPMYLQNGWTFVDEFFIQHQFQRYTSNKFQHPQPFWFFWFVLPLMTIPWLPFFLASILDLILRKTVKTRNQEEIEQKVEDGEYGFKTRLQEQGKEKPLAFHCSSLTTFALAWLLVPLVFFSFSGSKLPGYILPALPAALILTAQYVSRFTENNRIRAAALQAVAFAAFAFIVIALHFFVTNYARGETVKTLIETADVQGYTSEKILNFNTISHNAEFYGAGRLVRTEDGKQRRFFTTAEIVKELKRDGAEDVLALTPLEYVNQLTESDLIEAKVLDDNGELAIVLLKAK